MWAKITIGIVGIAASVALTVASGGAAFPALVATLQYVLGTMAISMAIYGIIGYIIGGSSGLKQGLLDGAADGFMRSGIGAAVSSAIKMVKLAKAGKIASSACFVAGTLISTENGFIPIEEIKQGDLVYSENPVTGEKELKHVVQTFIRETDEFVHIQVNGQNITTTPEHPFWTPKKGWTKAIELQVGDELVLQNGEHVIIERVQHELLETPVTVYNFEVEEFHTYYVSDSAILVHNACGELSMPKSPNKLTKNLAKKVAEKAGYAKVEDFKESILVSKQAVARFDLFQDTKTGIIWLMDKAKKIVINTGYKL